MFTYISIEEFADGVVKNNKDANRRDLIAALRESLAAKKNGAGCMICTTGVADDSEDYEIESPLPARSISPRACCVIWCF